MTLLTFYFRYINNIISEGEISSVAKNATELINKFDPRTGLDRETPVTVKFYNAVTIISIGYRTKSQRVTRFRKWETFIQRAEQLIKKVEIPIFFGKVLTTESAFSILDIKMNTHSCEELFIKEEEL